MALTKAKKAEKVEQLAKELEGSTSAIIGTFAKLTVSQDFELRKTVRAAGGRYRVLKNKLAARASKGSQIEAALQGLKGVSSVAYTSGDPVALAKALSTWVTENAEFTFKLGIVDGKVINVARGQGSGDHAGQGRDLREAPLPHQFPGAASGDGYQRDGPRPGSGHQPGRRERKFAGESSVVEQSPWRSREPQSAVAELPVAEALGGRRAAPEVSGGEGR